MTTTDTPMGATLVPGGATFRTWAPRATSVSLLTGPALDQALLAQALAGAGTPGWQPPPACRLAPLGDGTWGGFCPGATDGTAYMAWIEGAASAGLKRDPYARELSQEPPFPASLALMRDPARYPWHDAAWRPPAFHELVIYQLHVGTFWAAGPGGADQRATAGGRFLDVASRLPALQALGINAIQLLPVQEYATQFSEGYNGVDYFAPENRYVASGAALASALPGINAMLAAAGAAPLTAADLLPGVNQLKCLVDLAHLHGIAVIFDLVYNHAGGGFDPQSLWFYDRFTNGNLNNSLFFTDEGWAGGQVFAYWNPPVRQFLIDNASFWLEEYRIDGIRYDEVRVISNNRPGGRTLCQDITATARYLRPAAIQIAEYWEWDRAAPVTPPPGGLGFDAALGDALRDAVRALLAQAATGASTPLDLGAVAQALLPPPGYDAAWRLVQCLENHDITYAAHDGAARLPTLADPADRRSWYARSRCRAATALLFAAPGIPALFMGQEILEDKLWTDDTDTNPGLLVWWDGLATDPVMADYQHFMQDVIALRRSQPALCGEGVRISHVDSDQRVIVVHRWATRGPGRDVLAVVSFAEQAKPAYAIGLPQPGAWAELLNTDVYDGFPNPAPTGNGGTVWAGGPPQDGFAHSATLCIPANGALFLGRRG